MLPCYCKSIHEIIITTISIKRITPYLRPLSKNHILIIMLSTIFWGKSYFFYFISRFPFVSIYFKTEVPHLELLNGIGFTSYVRIKTKKSQEKIREHKHHVKHDVIVIKQFIALKWLLLAFHVGSWSSLQTLECINKQGVSSSVLELHHYMRMRNANKIKTAECSSWWTTCLNNLQDDFHSIMKWVETNGWRPVQRHL